jgi:hypothetical protein
MSESESSSRGSGSKSSSAIYFILALLVPFLPFLVAVGEVAAFGTTHFQDFLKEIGIYDLLDRFYRVTIFRLFS